MRIKLHEVWNLIHTYRFRALQGVNIEYRKLQTVQHYLGTIIQIFTYWGGPKRGRLLDPQDILNFEEIGVRIRLLLFQSQRRLDSSLISELHIPSGLNMATHFQLRVYDVVSTVPKGRVISYGSIANALKTSSRAVGTAMGKNRELWSSSSPAVDLSTKGKPSQHTQSKMYRDTESSPRMEP